MPELTLHGREVATVFDLLGTKENDITYSLGWALTRSDRLLAALLDEVFEQDSGDVHAVRLQEFVAGAGYTDIEVEADGAHLIVEAKRDWDLPGDDQLEQYARRFGDDRPGAIAVISECEPAYAAARLPREVLGIPVHFVRWHRVADLVEQTADRDGAGHAERRLLRDLHRYLRGVMTMQDPTSNMVYVVSLQTEQLGDSGLSFKDIVIDHGRYFHPVGGGGRWPRTPPNYFGFRFAAKLQQIRHVEDYAITDEPWADFPQLKPHVDWYPSQHFYYRLGPPIVPSQEVRTGKMWPNGRVWAALDLLLTEPTVADARDATNRRLGT